MEQTQKINSMQEKLSKYIKQEEVNNLKLSEV